MEEKNFMEEINLGEIPFDVDFHPSDNLVATALINGDLHLYRFSPDSVPVRQLEVHGHTDSCRAARFIDCGRVLLTASSDCSILATDVETGFKITHIHNAHKTAENRFPGINRLMNLTEFTVASGDDEGFLRVWDIRTRSCCHYFHAHQNYISDMAFASDAMQLLTTSGDGILSVYNLRTNSVKVKVEWYELSSVAFIKDDQKFVCGSPRGVILYSWECFQCTSGVRFFLHTNDPRNDPIDAMLKLDEDTIITGSDNGIINLVGISPDFIYPIAEHSGYLVECLALSHDKKFFGSIAYDKKLKLWNLDSMLPEPEYIELQQRCTPMRFE